MRRPWILVLLLCLGCASAAQKRFDQFDQVLREDVGKSTPRSTIEHWGPPTSRQQIEGFDVLTYYWGYGPAGTATLVASTVVASARERFDKVDLMFRDGVLYTYRISVQR